MKITQAEAKKELAKRELARRHLLDFVLYNYETYKVNWHHELLAKKLEAVERGEIKRLMVFMPPRHGKALAVDTPIFTTQGWKRMDELKVGDIVFDENGERTRIVAVSPVWKNRDVYRVRDKEDNELLADEAHEWLVRLDRKHKAKRIYETKFLANRTCLRKPLVETAKALDMDEVVLPIPPYVLGVWLGDGTSKQAIITEGEQDYDFIRNQIEQSGFKTTDQSTGGTFGILGLKTLLRENNLVGNKHIPDVYYLSSKEQRLALLQGLIDTDGYVSKEGQITFTSISKELAEGVAFLVRGLGAKASLREGKAHLNGRVIGKKYDVSFYLKDSARLPRRRSLMKNGVRTPGHYLSFEYAGKADTICIEVESKSHLFLAGKGLWPTHNSEMCSIQFPAWVIGKNRDRHIIQASYSADLAHDFGRQTRNLVNSQEFKNVFRDVELSDDSQSKGKWNTNGRGAYNAVGVGGAVTGKGADFLLIDDPIKNRQDANSSVYREAVWDWYRSTARTRLTPDGAIILIMTRWHEDDLAGRILRNDPEGWEVIELPAIAIQDEEHRKIGEALWPGHYSLETLEATKKDLGSFEWSSLYQQRPIDEESQEFKRDWFQEVEWGQVAVMDTAKYMTVDTAISESEGSDNTGVIMNYVSRENKWFFKAWKLRINAMELINFLFKVFMDERPDKIGIEETVYLKAIKPFLDEEQRRRNIFLPIEPLKHASRAKIARIRGLIPRYQSKSIFHIKGLCKDLEDELLSFPKGVHDDVADACAYQNDIAQPPQSNMNYRVYENRQKNKSFK